MDFHQTDKRIHPGFPCPFARGHGLYLVTLICMYAGKESKDQQSACPRSDSGTLIPVTHAVICDDTSPCIADPTHRPLWGKEDEGLMSRPTPSGFKSEFGFREIVEPLFDT